jgi:hypothetical protein
MMLSTNLYSNQQLACIRETLCNAWDAHIEAGTTHVPVKVTITAENELVIEDSGLGIPEDLFEEIYGTFGGSTKRLNKAVTGGFGLGCKSPWAYTESFRVISENQGKKVVYNLVRASVEVHGLPAITRVMEMPTERSGLTVRFQLKQQDVEQMVLYIRHIAMHGDMNVLFLREGHMDEPMQLPKLELDPTPGSYSVEASKWYDSYMGRHDLFVRYGAVVYPMLQTPGTQKAVNLLKEFMELVGFSKMVVQAAPGTLALTPNRETLSSSKMTEDGITELCVALVARIEEDIIRQIPGSIMQAVERLEKGDSYYSTLESFRDVTEVITPMSVRRYLESQLGRVKCAKYEAMLKSAEHRGFKSRHMFTNKAATHEYHRLRRRLAGRYWKERDQLYLAFAKHYVLRPLSRVFLKNPQVLKQNQLFHAGHFFSGNSTRQSRWLEHVNVREFDELQQLIDSPTVFITTRTKHLRKSIECCPWVTNESATWVYRLEPKQDQAAVIKAFEDSGMKVIDLTLNHDWDDGAALIESERAYRSANRKAATGTLPGIETKKVRNMLMSLSNVYHADGQRKMGVEHIKVMKNVTEMSNTPLFYVEVDRLGKEGSLGSFGHYLDLDDNERKHGVIVRGGIEKNMAIRRGAVDMNAYLAQKLWARVHTKEYETYCTKLRRPALQHVHKLGNETVEILDYLGVKLPGLDKLITDLAMERALEQTSSISATTFAHYMPQLTMEEMRHYSQVVTKFELIELPSIAKIKTLKKDRMLQRLLWDLDMLKQYPERKAALKSLVMSALKNGKQDE